MHARARIRIKRMAALLIPLVLLQSCVAKNDPAATIDLLALTSSISEPPPPPTAPPLPDLPPPPAPASVENRLGAGVVVLDPNEAANVEEVDYRTIRFKRNDGKYADLKKGSIVRLPSKKAIVLEQVDAEGAGWIAEFRPAELTEALGSATIDFSIPVRRKGSTNEPIKTGRQEKTFTGPGNSSVLLAAQAEVSGVIKVHLQLENCDIQRDGCLKYLSVLYEFDNPAEIEISASASVRHEWEPIEIFKHELDLGGPSIDLGILHLRSTQF